MKSSVGWLQQLTSVRRATSTRLQNGIKLIAWHCCWLAHRAGCTCSHRFGGFQVSCPASTPHPFALQDVLMIPVVLPNASVRLRLQPGEYTG